VVVGSFAAVVLNIIFNMRPKRAAAQVEAQGNSDAQPEQK